MSEFELAPELRELVAARVTSIEQLDALMLLYSTPDRSWTAAQVATKLGTAPESAGMRLFLLTAAGLLESAGSADRQYRFSTAASPLAVFMTPLAEAYENDRNEVARALYGSTPSPIKNFADAFKLK